MALTAVPHAENFKAIISAAAWKTQPSWMQGLIEPSILNWSGGMPRAQTSHKRGARHEPCDLRLSSKGARPAIEDAAATAPVTANVGGR